MRIVGDKQAALDDLKAQWTADPNWDIEDTEGFEWAHDELLTYRQEMEAQWEQLRQQRIRARAEALGCSFELMCYLEGLERKIIELQRKVYG